MKKKPIGMQATSAQRGASKERTSLSFNSKLRRLTCTPYQASTRQMKMQKMPMPTMARRRIAGLSMFKPISTKTWPFSRTSQGAPKHGTMSSAYSVKVNRCAELCSPRLRNSTSMTMAANIAAIKAPANQAMARISAS